MRSRPVPSSLIWLALLLAIAVGAAAAAGVTLYLQTRQAARVQANAMTGGDWRRGEAAIVRYRCGSCHVIPGVGGATGRVGPDLTDIGTRAILAGRLPNDPALLAAFVRDPQRHRPGTAMPDLGVGDADSHDIAAYLYAR